MCQGDKTNVAKSKREEAMLNPTMPDSASVREQLERLRFSAAFARSGRLFSFLSFIVEETLARRGETLKELVVGDTLYARHTPYDPRIDSTVRVEARRLRQKLEGYYAGPGLTDAIHIVLPTGSYRPILLDRAAGTSVQAESRTDLAIMPFRALSNAASDDSFADGLTDELIFAFEQTSGLRIAPRLSVFQYKNGTYSVTEAAEALGATALLHGTYRCQGNRNRVTVELSDHRGFVTWSDRVEAATTEQLMLQETLARQIVACLPNSILAAPRASQNQPASLLN